MSDSGYCGTCRGVGTQNDVIFEFVLFENNVVLIKNILSQNDIVLIQKYIALKRRRFETKHIQIISFWVLQPYIDPTHCRPRILLCQPLGFFEFKI